MMAKRDHLTLTPEQIGAEVRAGLRERCDATKTVGNLRLVCTAARHDAEVGISYGQSLSHYWVPVGKDT